MISEAAPGALVFLEYQPFAVTVSVAQVTADDLGLGHTATGRAIVPLLPVRRVIETKRYLASKGQRADGACTTGAAEPQPRIR